jgi:hypothetical protein
VWKKKQGGFGRNVRKNCAGAHVDGLVLDLRTYDRNSLRRAAKTGYKRDTELSFGAGKVCSGAIGGTFRDTVNVPDTYKMSDCEALARKMVLTVARHSRNFTYSVGCLTANGYSWSENPEQKPNPNSCNW